MDPIQNQQNPSTPPVAPTPAAPAPQAPVAPPPVVPPTAFGAATPFKPSVKRQSWGALISLTIIVLMIVIGAFYAWGERIAQSPSVESSETAE